MNWSYFILGVFVYQLVYFLIKTINHEVVRYRQRRFLKLVHIFYPAGNKITFISIETTDKKAMKDLERQLRKQYEVDTRFEMK